MKIGIRIPTTGVPLLTLVTPCKSGKVNAASKPYLLGMVFNTVHSLFAVGPICQPRPEFFSTTVAEQCVYAYIDANVDERRVRVGLHADVGSAYRSVLPRSGKNLMAIRVSSPGELPPPVDLRVFRLSKGESIHVRCLCAPDVHDRQGLLGYLTHWHQGRSKLCRGPGDCEASIHRINPIWYGFLPMEFWDENSGFWIAIVLQVTESLELDFRHKLQRGQTWTISRPAVKKSGCPVRGELTGTCDLENLPEPFPIVSTLQTVYHWPELPLPKTPNPTPGRVALTPSRGSPPPGSKALERFEEKSNRLSPDEQRELLRKARERLKDPPINGHHKPNAEAGSAGQ
jgi:hypothetical protein